jgi:N-acyl-L-homoserine lactone synthetase
MSAATCQLHLSDRGGSKKGISHHIAELLARVEYGRADSSQERDAIGRLRYQAYLREGAISANPSKTFSDPYDETDNAYLFGLHIDGALASSLRLHIASKRNSDCPSLEVFADVLQPLLDEGKVLIDATRFVADEKFSRLHRGLPYVTVRLCVLAAEHFGGDHLLAAVRAEHQPFYRRAFNHRLLCQPRPYPQLAKPISLMTLHFPSTAEQIYRRHPYFRSSLLERRMLFDRRHGPAPFDREPAEARHPAAQEAANALSLNSMRCAPPADLQRSFVLPAAILRSS